jgi:adenylylsulfate kinase
MQKVPYYECYIKCSLSTCEARDPKNLYKRARAGEIKNMTGIGSPNEEPENPDLIIETDRLTLDQSVAQVIAFLTSAKVAFPKPALNPRYTFAL